MMNSFDSNLEHIINMNENTELIDKPDPKCGKYVYYFIVYSFTIVIITCIFLLVIFYTI